MKKYINLAILTIFAVLLSQACRKGSAGPSIIGTWGAYKQAVDLNGNGVMDANEVFADTIDKGWTLTFNANHTLVFAYLGFPSATMTWALLYKNSYLQTTDTSGGFPSIIYQKIDNLSSSSLTLRDTTGGTISWSILARQ